MNYSSQEKIILKKLTAAGGTGNVVEFLEYDSAQFEKAFSIANDLQNKDLVKVLYSNFNKNLIVVEATLLAHEAAKES